MSERVPKLISFRVADGTECDLQFLLNAPFEDISEAADKIPAALGWLGYQRSLAVERLILAEHQWKRTEAEEFHNLKNGGYVAQGFGDKPSVEAIKLAVLLMDSVQTACQMYAKRKRHVEWLTSSIDALKAKLDLVRSSEVTRRMEHEPDRMKGTVI